MKLLTWTLFVIIYAITLGSAAAIFTHLFYYAFKSESWWNLCFVTLLLILLSGLVAWWLPSPLDIHALLLGEY